MGMFGGSKYNRDDCEWFVPASRNPDPKKYNILEAYHTVDCTVLKVKYDGCTNYEGIKILVFDTPIKELITLKELDPHFSKNKVSPVARFVPTDQGWNMAIECVNRLQGNKDSFKEY